MKNVQTFTLFAPKLCLVQKSVNQLIPFFFDFLSTFLRKPITWLNDVCFTSEITLITSQYLYNIRYPMSTNWSLDILFLLPLYPCFHFVIVATNNVPGNPGSLLYPVLLKVIILLISFRCIACELTRPSAWFGK